MKGPDHATAAIDVPGLIPNTRAPRSMGMCTGSAVTAVVRMNVWTWPIRQLFRAVCCALLVLQLLATEISTADESSDPDHSDRPTSRLFFEQRIEPVLIDRCYKCHSGQSEEPAGGLLLDTRQGIRRGGDLGPAVVPGDPEESLLLSAIAYESLEMPPDEKLDDAIIQDFRRWIEAGAVDPRDDGEVPSTHMVATAQFLSVHWQCFMQVSIVTQRLSGTFNWPMAVVLQIGIQDSAAGR